MTDKSKGLNKGEWSEPYVALRLLGEGKLFVADADGNKNPNEWMKVIELIRYEAMNRMVTYRSRSNNLYIDINVDDNFMASLPASEFLVMAEHLAEEIRKGKGRTFSVSQATTDFLQSIEMKKLKASSVDKSDIFLSLSDPRSGITRERIGFSIKSQFGENPTLFNTANASAVIYKLTGMNEELKEKINSLRDSRGKVAVGERCSELIKNNCTLEFVGFPIAKRAKCAAFEENLDLINPRLKKVIERLLWNYFFEHDSTTDINAVMKKIINSNPCKISLASDKYPYMMKAFLYAAYCGMTASTLWDGNSQVNGGFIKVNENGEVLAYYALESDAFKTYLYNNCYLEFPSTDEKHGNYAKVYQENGEYYFRLNFQIRYRV